MVALPSLLTRNTATISSARGAIYWTTDEVSGLTALRAASA